MEFEDAIERLTKLMSKVSEERFGHDPDDVTSDEEEYNDFRQEAVEYIEQVMQNRLSKLEALRSDPEIVCQKHNQYKGAEGCCSDCSAEEELV